MATRPSHAPGSATLPGTPHRVGYSLSMTLADPDTTPARPPRRSRSGQDAPINSLRTGEAARAFIPTVLYGKCPNCRHEYMYASWIKVKPTCGFCGVRFERDPGSFLVLLGLNYLIAITLSGILAWVLIANFGLFNGLTPILAAAGLISVVAFYHLAKSLYIWILWVFGFVYND